MAERLPCVVLQYKREVENSVKTKRTDNMMRTADKTMPSQRLKITRLAFGARGSPVSIPTKRIPKELADYAGPAARLLVSVDLVARQSLEHTKFRIG